MHKCEVSEQVSVVETQTHRGTHSLTLSLTSLTHTRSLTLTHSLAARTSLISSSIDQTVMISDTRTKYRMILCRRASFLAPSALRCAARLPCASQLPPLAALQPTLAWGSRSSSTKSNEGAAAPVDDTKPKLMFEGAKNKIVKTLKLASIANLGFAVAAGTPALAPCHEFSAHSPSVSVPQSRSCSTSPLRQVRAARVWR